MILVFNNYFECFVSQVDGPGTREPKSGPIIIKIKNFRGESKENYKFIDPVITDIEPRHGPQAGGTKIKIKGEYLNAGSHVEAYIGDLECRIIKTRRKVALCVTSRSPRLQKLDVKMHFDHGKARVLERKRFEYVADPTIEFSFSGKLIIIVIIIIMMIVIIIKIKIIMTMIIIIMIRY